MIAAKAAQISLEFQDTVYDLADKVMAHYPLSTAVFSAYAEQAIHGTTAREHALAVEPILAALDEQSGVNAAQFVAEASTDYGIVALWSRGKNVYDIDPTLWGQLQRVDQDTPIPADLFSRLRHTDPFIAFPEPIIMPVSEPGVRARLTGFFVTGRAWTPNGSTATVSTHHGSMAMVAACVGGYTAYEDGRPYLTPDGTRDILWARLFLDPSFEDGSIRAMVKAASTKFYSPDGTGDGPTYVATVLPQIVAALVYCCAENADLETMPVPPKRGKGGRRLRNTETPRTTKVGYRVGRAIQKGMEQHATRRAVGGQGSGLGGWVMPPHIRAPHFQRFRHGKGKQEVKVLWVDPVAVNLDLGETVPVVRKVRPPVKSSRQPLAADRSRVRE